MIVLQMAAKGVTRVLGNPEQSTGGSVLASHDVRLCSPSSLFNLQTQVALVLQVPDSKGTALYGLPPRHGQLHGCSACGRKRPQDG